MMDMLQVFHMNKGEGAASYAENCTVQKEILSITKPLVEEAIREYYIGADFPETLAIADLGCSSGPTALKAVWEIMDQMGLKCRQMGRRSSPKFMVFLNDLPGNDFNKVFASLSNFHDRLREEKGDDFGPCFIAGLPGSFHGRLLPTKVLHFVHSSSSLHWLSQVPPGMDGKENPMMLNKGKIYLSVTSPSYVINAYTLQFQNDFLTFLKCRSEEVIHGGRMVLTLMGRRSIDPTCEQGCFPWEFIAQSLMTMVSEGLIEEEKVDGFNVPYYAPCVEELKELIEKEASFCCGRLEAFEVDWDGGQEDFSNVASCGGGNLTKGERIAKMHRAVVESMLQHHFGAEIMDELFSRYGRILDHHLILNQKSKIVTLGVSLIRK